MQSTTLADIKTVAETVEAVVISLAAIVGGWWAVFKFSKLLELPIAAANLAKAQADYESLRRSLEQRGTVNLSVAIRPSPASEQQLPHVAVQVTATNLGNRMEELSLGKATVHTAPVVGHDGGDVVLGEWTETKLQRWGGRDKDKLLEPGASHQFLFVVPVASPGLYLVSADIPVSAKSAAEAKALGREGEGLSWSIDAIIAVPAAHKQS